MLGQIECTTARGKFQSLEGLHEFRLDSVVAGSI